jgi:two-component system, LytTR family, sensor kinase
LQPLVENCIRHGLASKIDGGTIRVRSRLSEDGRLHIHVEDDGVGISDGKLSNLFEKRGDSSNPNQGIGVSNIDERLQVLYGGDYKMWVDSRVGEGTTTGIELPSQTPPTAVSKNTPSAEALGVS